MQKLRIHLAWDALVLSFSLTGSTSFILTGSVHFAIVVGFLSAASVISSHYAYVCVCVTFYLTSIQMCISVHVCVHMWVCHGVRTFVCLCREYLTTANQFPGLSSLSHTPMARGKNKSGKANNGSRQL